MTRELKCWRVLCSLEGGGFKADEKVTGKVAVWLNRVLALTLQDQDLLFKYFSDTYDALITAAKSRGKYDQGIRQLTATSVEVSRQTPIHTDASSGIGYLPPLFSCGWKPFSVP